MSTDKFITKAHIFHGDKYDYSFANYVDLKTKVSIKCPEHGLFEITPNEHLNGVGCPKCDYLYHKASNRIKQLSGRIEFPIPQSFVAIDFETLYPQRVSACSVGMAKYKDGQLEKTYYSLIRPPHDYEGKKGEILTNKHHITESMVENERTMVDIMPEIERFVEGLPMVAHNASVERDCIRDTANFYGIQTNLDYNHIYDTQVIAELVEIFEGNLISGPDSHALDTICERFGVEEIEHHNALDDAKVCGELLNVFAKKMANYNAIVWPLHEIIYKKKKWGKEKYKQEDLIPRSDVDNIRDNYFKGKSVCLTGFQEEECQKYGHQLWDLGAFLKKSMSKKVDVLICGEKPGPTKVKIAEEYNIAIINTEELLTLIQYE